MTKGPKELTQLFFMVCVSVLLGACSPISDPTDNPFTVRPNMRADANGKPLVWDCTVVQMSSPPRYACSDNKTYTAFELRDIRLDNEAVVTTTPVFEPRHVPRQ